MDLFFLPSIPQFLIIVVAFIVLFVLYTTWTHKTFEKMGIPGPKPGFFGNMTIFKEKGVTAADAYLVKEYGKVVGTFFGRAPAMLIADPEMMKQICIKEFSKFTNRKNILPVNKLFRGGLTLAEDEHWRFARSIISPTFSSGKMRYMTPLVQTALEKLVEGIRDQMKKDDKVEAKGLFGAFTLDVIGSTGFGLDIDSQRNPDSEFVARVKDVMNPTLRVKLLFVFVALMPFLAPLLNLLDISTVNRKNLHFFQSVADSIISGRSQADSKRKDLVQLMLNARLLDAQDRDEDEDESTRLHYTPQSPERALSREEIVANSILFILAGYETTATTLTFAAYLLATNPECQERLHEEVIQHLGKDKPTYDSVWKLEYLDNVISETLRLYGPASRTSRLCNEDTVINGITIPEGMDVHISLYCIHHDPELWPDPEKFDPDRFLPENKAGRHPCAWVPFGVGPRNCVGMRLALLELKMVLATVVQHFRIVPSDETKIPMELDKVSGLTKPLHDVILRMEERE